MFYFLENQGKQITFLFCCNFCWMLVLSSLAKRPPPVVSVRQLANSQPHEPHESRPTHLVARQPEARRRLPLVTWNWR